MRRSTNNLLGNHINIKNGRWTAPDASIGGNCDSFYEYLAKNAILFGNEEHRMMFLTAYTSIMKYLFQSPWYISVNMDTKQVTNANFESLQAFWPGVQVLIGDIDMAVRTMHAFHGIWRKYDAVPESYDLLRKTISSKRNQYPLRPEMAESLYYLYGATKNPIWLQYGKEMIDSIEKYAKVDCGIAAVEDVVTKELRDHMDSFFLSETCKYLYLLFTPNDPIISKGNYVFNTEGHPFPIRYEWFDKTYDGYGMCPKITYFSTDNLSSKFNIKDYFKIDNNDNDIKSANDKDLFDYSITYSVATISLIEPLYSNSNLEELVFFSNFGPKSIDESLNVILKYTEPFDACSDIITEFNENEYAFVTRGDCSFVEKVKYCQDAGASGVIVMNNDESENGITISMSGDDDSIEIPSFIISNSFGSQLIDLFDEETIIILNIEQQESQQIAAEPIIIDLSEFDLESDPTLAIQHLQAVIASMGLENDELTNTLENLLLNNFISEEDEDMIELDVGLQGSPKLVGKHFEGCINGKC